MVRRIGSAWVGSSSGRAARKPAADGRLAGAARRVVERVAEFLERRQLLSTTWYVATTGSDSSAGTLGAPFQTIQHAASLAQPGDTVMIRGGIYHETATPANSGTPGNPITYEAYNRESVTIDGADPISNWTGSSTYQASMNWDLGEGNNAVFVNGVAQTEARWPDIGSNPSTPNVATAQAVSTNGSAITIYDSNLTQAANYWVGATIHFTPGQQWVAYTATVTASGPGYVSFNFTAPDSSEAVNAGTKYDLTATPNALNASGEWYYNAGTQTLSLIPSTGDNANNDLVEAKHRQFGFNLAGISYTTIEGINFFACTVNTDASSGTVTLDHISVLYASQFVSQPNGWAEPAVCGVILAGTGDTLSNSTIAYSSGDGVYVSGGWDQVRNNVIHDVDLNAADAAGVRNYGYNNFIEYNTIYNCGRDGIMAFGGYSHFLYNNIYNFMLQTTDGAGIYTIGSYGGGSEIGYNRIWAGHTGGYGAGGIYLDNDSSSWLVDHNITWNVDYGIKINNSSYNEQIYDNTFDATQYSLGVGGTGMNWAGSTIIDNIFTRAMQDGESNVTWGANLYPWQNADLASDESLQWGSPAIDAGQVNAPYTNGYVGAAPDLGALEYGTTAFSSGAALDWTPTAPVFHLTAPASPPPPPPPVAPPSGQFTDPGFESPSVGSGSYGAFAYDPANAGWTFTGSAGISGNGSGFTAMNPNAPEGAQVAFLQMTGSISQTVTLATGTFAISFQAAQRVQWQYGLQDFQVLVDGAPLATFKPAAGGAYAMDQTGGITLGAGTHTITFKGLDSAGGDNTAFIDNVQILTAPTLNNPGFEGPSVGNATYGAFQYDPANAGWTFTGSAGVTGNGSGFTAGNPNAPGGTQVGFLQMAGSSITQTVTLATGTYVVSFQAAQRIQWQYGGLQDFQVLIDGNVVGTLKPSGGGGYASYQTVAFTAAGGAHTITFKGLDTAGGDNTAFIDNVQVGFAPVTG